MTKTFEDLEFGPHPNHPGGIRATLEYPNGYGVSVIKTPYSYGGDDGLYELGVTRGGSLTYETPVTSDVEGHLSPDDVSEIMAKVEALETAA